MKRRKELNLGGEGKGLPRTAVTQNTWDWRKEDYIDHELCLRLYDKTRGGKGTIG